MEYEMSKSFDKTVAAVKRVLTCIPMGTDGVQLDVGKFREAFKLTSEPKKRLAASISDILTLSDVVDTHGTWCIAEVQHPVYQLNLVSLHDVGRIVFNTRFDPILIFYDDGRPGEDDGDSGDSEDDSANEKALEAEDKERKAELADQTREEESDGEGENKSWGIEDASLSLKAEFNSRELQQLLDMKLIGPESSDPHSVEYLRMQLGQGVKKAKPAPKSKKAGPKSKKPAPKAKAAKKVGK
jgi:hypothetical protein